MEVKFNACKHLDFEEKYINCKRQMLYNNKLFWLREKVPADFPKMVQFCKKRGRMNAPGYCLNEDCAGCSDYEDFEHIVDVDEEELK